jgi:diaminohydroxyphosphoribosylaminopyrimidine deaminase/5-amino-6-(5-phosphoribosylamino)uracil reductase
VVEHDQTFMRRALVLAREGWGQTAPNPMVGAVVVRDGEIVGEGHHARFGTPHGEAVALRAAGDRARGATLYVTLEPCVHMGKTGPCVDAILAAGVTRVVIAILDPNPTAAGGAARLRAAGVDVTVGVEGPAARELNAAFFHSFVSDRPWVTLKLAISADEAIAPVGKQQVWITGPESRREAHHLRANHDAIAVGIGTVLADDPLLTVRGVPASRVSPVRVVFDTRSRTPLDSALVRSIGDAPLLVFTREPDSEASHLLRARGAEVEAHTDLADALRILRARDVRSVLVEGGAAIASAMLRAELVDRMVTFQAPILLGNGALNPFAGLTAEQAEALRRLPVLERRPIGDDLMTVYAMETTGVHRAD